MYTGDHLLNHNEDERGPLGLGRKEAKADTKLAHVAVDGAVQLRGTIGAILPIQVIVAPPLRALKSTW